MARYIFSPRSISIALLVAILVALLLPAATFALPQYSTATGQACTVCHVNATGGPRTAAGQRFEAIPNHATNAAAAWQQASQPAQATPAPTAAPAATPAPAATAAPAATPATGGKGAPAPTTLPRTGGVPFEPFLLGAAAMIAAGWGMRRRGR